MKGHSPLALVVFLAFSSSVWADGPFPDKALEAAVRSSLTFSRSGASA